MTAFQAAQAALSAALPNEVSLTGTQEKALVRAVLRAIREPDPEMSTAGKHAVKGCESTFEREIAETAFKVMIDAALEENP